MLRNRVQDGIWQTMRIIAAIGLIAAGTQGFMLALREHAPVMMTYAQFARETPTSGWFHINGAKLDLNHSVPTHNSSGRAVSRLIPVVNAIGPNTPAVLLASSSGDDLDPNVIDGVLEVNFLDQPDDYEKAVLSLGSRVAATHRVMNLGAKPGFVLYLVLMIVGYMLALVLLAPLIARFLRRSMNDKTVGSTVR